MVLELGYIEIKDLVFGQETRVHGSTLVVDQDAFKEALRSGDDRIQGLNLALAKPGQSTRIICVKDVIEPRCKVDGHSVGEGRTHILRNVAVVSCGKIVGFQEGLIDMSGAGAEHSPFSRTLNLVVEVEVAPELPPHAHEEVVRHAGLKAAGLLAEAARTLRPAEVERYHCLDTLEGGPKLPRVAYLYMLLSQGLLHDSYVLGRNAREGLPCIIPLPLLMDGAITSGNCVSACDKNTTYHHQNNPLVRELYQHHLQELNFAGVVLTNEPVRLAAKEASARKAVELVKTLKADAVIISKEGFGNPDTDQMLLIRGLEEAGVLTVSITDEYAGDNGASQSLADATPQARAMISVGNANERILLPPMERLLGPLEDLTRLAGAYPHSLHQDGSLEVELQAIIGSTNQLGFHTLRCREV
ncbi:glycine/sarcosine/betaine reductase component B subunit [Desulfogranum mediterraneum]|uniref:glycine/sarcosine/betaine reductase component B subunit n=1 Tax=Desulfogranum mediterraneum TaxID=160661 RepID=UPI0004174BAB|nr:glycine/sarcosine/betaine reductase component B subunit [Desulfogranum mediterraneum]